MLRLIAQLYALEGAWDEAQIGDRRAALRRAHFAQPLARLRRLATALQARLLPKSGLGQACAYLLGHWAPLTAHLRHSQTQLDTNAVENAIRPSKLGAKNWLFVGHPAAGDRPAVIYSLIVSCQRYGLDLHAYLRDVLARLPAMTTTDDLRPLLPSRWHPPTLPVSYLRSGLRRTYELVKGHSGRRLRCILAWRIFWMTMVNRVQPEAAPASALSPVEIDVLDGLIRRQSAAAPPPRTRAIYLTQTARLGGYLGRAHETRRRAIS